MAFHVTAQGLFLMKMSCSNPGKEKLAGSQKMFPPGLWALLISVIFAGCAQAVVLGLEPKSPVQKSSHALWPHEYWNYGSAFADSLQPTLQWEAFPRPHDPVEGQEEVLSQVSGVSYELKLWRADSVFPVRRFWPGGVIELQDPVYVRQKLPNPWHRIEVPLEPCSVYFWTIRARFELHGRLRVTRWAELMTQWSIRMDNKYGEEKVFYHNYTAPCG